MSEGELYGDWDRPTSGTPVVATKLWSFCAAYFFRCDEKAESVDCAGWTETITSLDRYATLATISYTIDQQCPLSLL